MLSQSLKVKFFYGCSKTFFAVSNTLQEVASSFYFFIDFLSTRYGATQVIR